jgi:hypothetical protein
MACGCQSRGDRQETTQFTTLHNPSFSTCKYLRLSCSVPTSCLPRESTWCEEFIPSCVQIGLGRKLVWLGGCVLSHRHCSSLISVLFFSSHSPTLTLCKSITMCRRYPVNVCCRRFLLRIFSVCYNLACSIEMGPRQANSLDLPSAWHCLID